MPRFIFHREKNQSNPPPQISTNEEAPEGLRKDDRIEIIDEMPRMLLVDCPENVASEWLAQMPGWKLQRESKAKIPDARPKLKKPRLT